MKEISAAAAHSQSDALAECLVCPVRMKTAYAGLDETVLARLADVRRGQVEFPEKALVVREGDSCAEFYSVRDGWIFNYKLLPDGRRQIINFILPGDVVDISSLGTGHSLASVQTVTPATLCVFDRVAFNRLIGNAPMLAETLQARSATELASIHDRMASIGRRSARERIAHLILAILHRRSNGELVEGRAHAWPLRQEHVADALGLTPIHVNRTIRSLREEGLLSLRGSKLEVHRHRDLVRLANIGSNVATPD